MRTKKFKELFDFAPKSNIKAGDGLDEGTFPFYTSSGTLRKRIAEANHFREALVLGTGGSANIHYAGEPFSTSTDCLVAISKDKNLITKYVYYYLSGNIHLLERGFKGAGLKHISKSYIDNLEIPLVPLEAQFKIVTLLDQTTFLINKRKIATSYLDELLRAFFLEVFGDPILNTHNWPIENLGSIAKLQRGRFSPRPRNDPSYFDGSYPFIQTGDISRAEHRISSYTQTLNEKGIKVSKEFKQGTIVIAIVGATIGATAICEIDVYATDSIIGINPQKKYANKYFLEFLLRFWKPILLESAPEAARPNINLEILNKLKIILPPTPLQNKFSLLLEKIGRLKSQHKQSLAELEILFNSLSQRAFKNQLDLSNVYVAPFEVDGKPWPAPGGKGYGDPFEGIEGLSKDVLFGKAELEKLAGKGWEHITEEIIEGKRPQNTEIDAKVNLEFLGEQYHKYAYSELGDISPIINQFIKSEYFTFEQLKEVVVQGGLRYDFETIKNSVFGLMRDGKIKQIFADSAFKASFEKDDAKYSDVQKLEEKIYLQIQD